MRTIRIRSLPLAALAWFALTASSPAQEKSPALLNALEVRQLIARTAPADHARLSAHFAAVTDRHTAEPKRHTSMAQGFVGNQYASVQEGA